MAETRTLELGEGRSLHAVIKGEGPDVLLLHGMLETGHDWLVWQLDWLVQAGCRVTVVDRPGHGLSRRRRFDGTPRAQAKQIREGLDALGIDRLLILSHSYGGLVSLAYAEQFPEAVASLVMVAPVAFPEPRLLEHSLLAPRSVPFFGPIFSTAADATIDRLVLKLVQKLMFSPQEVPASWEKSFPYDQLLDPGAMVFQGEDAAAILPMSPAGTIDVTKIGTPAHILTGTSDRIIEDERQGKRLARLMPNARLTEVEGVGHMFHHVRPELVLDAVKEALAPA
jgi:pimeloyl-ACP methyl ester carboxylesterase